ncbi:MAG TPA: hypothetical protein VJL37_01840 [Flavobacterium sp.]|nr:hypothetical protein [Flavobacterium sp.]
MVKTSAQKETIQSIGDSALYNLYQQYTAQHTIVFDTLKSNPLKNTHDIKEVAFEVKKEFYERDTLSVYASKLQFGTNQTIQFIEGKNGMLTLFNKKPYTIRKLFGEMFNKASDIYFHYDSGKLYQLKNGNYLYVEQPERWSGSANQFDLYQLFDVQKKEVIQFAEKDAFIATLK